MVTPTDLPRNGIPVDPAIDYSHPILREPPHWTESEDEPEQSSSWLPVDVAAAMLGGEIAPDLGARADGRFLLYKGKVHWFFGTFESGKTWAALFFAGQVLNSGGRVLYLDFEDDARGIGWRLVQLGVLKSVVCDPTRFTYIRPDESLGSESARNAFDQSLSVAYDLAVLDGVTESIALEDLKDNHAGDVATWLKRLPKAVASRTGAAVVCLDHVPRDQGNRAMAIGSQHKMSGLDGVAYKFNCVEKFGKTKRGQSDMRVVKDRPGGVRGPLGVDYDPSDGSHFVGSFIMDATNAEVYSVSITALADGQAVSKAEGKPTEPQRPTWCMERIIERLQSDIDGELRGFNAVVKHMHKTVRGKGNKAISEAKWRAALMQLVEGFYVFRMPGPRNAQLHYGFGTFVELDKLKPDERLARAKVAVSQFGSDSARG